MYFQKTIFIQKSKAFAKTSFDMLTLEKYLLKAK